MFKIIIIVVAGNPRADLQRPPQRDVLPPRHRADNGQLPARQTRGAERGQPVVGHLAQAARTPRLLLHSEPDQPTREGARQSCATAVTERRSPFRIKKPQSLKKGQTRISTDLDKLLQSTET